MSQNQPPKKSREERDTLVSRLATVKVMLKAARVMEQGKPSPEGRGAVAYWEQRVSQLQRELDENT